MKAPCAKHIHLALHRSLERGKGEAEEEGGNPPIFDRTDLLGRFGQLTVLLSDPRVIHMRVEEQDAVT